MGIGWAEDTMMVASLEELSKEGGRLLPLVVTPAETEVDPEEKKLSVTGGETGLQPVEKGTLRNPSSSSLSEESLSGEADAGRRTKRFRVNAPITPPRRSMNQFSNLLRSNQILK